MLSSDLKSDPRTGGGHPTQAPWGRVLPGRKHYLKKGIGICRKTGCRGICRRLRAFATLPLGTGASGNNTGRNQYPD